MMTKSLDHNLQDTDSRLADFTDQVLAAAKGEAPHPAESDPELQGLEKTVLRLRQITPNTEPDPAMAARIRNRAAYEWRMANRASEGAQAPSPTGRNLLEQLRSPRTMVLSFATLGLVVLVALAVLSPGRDAPLSGAAGGQETWLTVAAAGLLVGVLLALIWRNRR